MSTLLDTHILVWLTTSPERIPAPVLKVLSQRKSKLYYSIASLWEITVKLGIGKIKLDLNEFINELKYTEINLLPITEKDIFVLKDLPLLHKDPFDRMLIAQAINANYKFITHDKAMAQYSPKLVISV
jgi:PIN domain nuclease of toxin-antitoxin system